MVPLMELREKMNALKISHDGFVMLVIEWEKKISVKNIFPYRSF